MAIRSRVQAGFTGDPQRDRLRRKADQHWNMAGLARQDGDQTDSERHMNLAREYEQQLRDSM